MKNLNVKGFILTILIFLCFGASAQVIAASNMITGTDDGTQWLNWFVRHWQTVGFVISELAALLPGKASGIIQTIVIIINKTVESIKQSKKESLS